MGHGIVHGIFGLGREARTPLIFRESASLSSNIAGKSEKNLFLK